MGLGDGSRSADGGGGGGVLSLLHFLSVRQPFALAAFGRQI